MPKREKLDPKQASAIEFAVSMNVHRGKITGGKRGKLENVAINHADATVDATANSKDVALNVALNCWFIELVADAPRIKRKQLAGKQEVATRTIDSH